MIEYALKRKSAFFFFYPFDGEKKKKMEEGFDKEMLLLFKGDLFRKPNTLASDARALLSK